MADPNLPTLTLFTRSPSRPKKEVNIRSIKEDHSILDVLKQSNKIQNQPYVTHITPAVSAYQNQYMRIRNKMELDYLNTYYDVIRQRPISQPSYHSTQRAQSFQSFGGAKAQCAQHYQTSHHTTQRTTQNFNTFAKAKCECQQNHPISVQQQRLAKPTLVKFAYLANQNPPMRPPTPAPIPFNQKNINIQHHALNRTAYLDVKKTDQNKSIHPQFSIIHQLNQNPSPLLKNEDVSKFINESKNVNNNQSLIIEEHHHVQQKATEVQTQENFANKSVFMINTSARQSQVMNKKNFQKTMKDLNVKIHNLKMQLDSEDVIIDLSDLILTKDQYIDESKGILYKLNALSEGRSVSFNNQMTGSLVWPEGI